MDSSQHQIQLPAEPASPGQARRFVAGQLRARGAEELVDVGILLTSELVTNAVVHAGGTIDLTVDCDEEAVRVLVSDHDPARPVPQSLNGSTTSGRGLSLVDALASRWGTDDVAGNGKRVWFELHR